jgi:hypothetical protein
MSAWQRVTAPQDEYLAYRSFRTSRELDERLAASAAYLERYPDGRWRAQVRPWVERAEARFYELAKGSRARLEAYLATLPDGPHADAVRDELRIARAEARRARTERQRAAAVERELAARARDREKAALAFSQWLGRLLDIRAWGKRTSSLDHEFLLVWRLTEPEAQCVDQTCRKRLLLPFSLPRGGDKANREMRLQVVIELDQGLVHEARLQGPALFSRLYEASTAKPVPAHDLGARVRAIAYAVEVVAGAAEARLPAARCAQTPVAPTVLLRSCNGWTLRAVVGEDPTAPDQVVVRGSPTSAATPRTADSPSP